MVPLAILLILASVVTPTSGACLNQKLLVISFDGFRQMYLNSTLLPWFSEFWHAGVISTQVRSVFPSETFPNHYSIATGLYSESHGIVQNNFFDPNLNKTFDQSNIDVEFWNEGTPIWTSAKRESWKRTAVSFWPGSAVPFENGMPDYWRPYDSRIPFETRIDEVVGYLANDEVDLAMLYFNQPDNKGHSYGPGSVAVTETVQRVDWYLSYILLQLQKVNLDETNLNIVLCADHGMLNITKPLLVIYNYVDGNAIDQISNYGTSMGIWPKPDQIDAIMANLTKAAAESNGKFKAYLRKDTPAEFHYSNNDRIAPIVVICSAGYYMSKYSTTSHIATHGWDPKELPMQPIFMARGPAFKSGGYVAKNMFETKDIHAIMAYVVGISTPHVNSSLSLISDIFADEAAAYETAAYSAFGGVTCSSTVNRMLSRTQLSLLLLLSALLRYFY